MNKVEDRLAVVDTTLKVGSIWKTQDKWELFMLCGNSSEGFVAICLADGNFWRGVWPDKPKAVEGLTLVTNEVSIIVANK